ncbi:hypothetical protein Tco_0512105 [Tanacetum coccineum]
MSALRRSDTENSYYLCGIGLRNRNPQSKIVKKVIDKVTNSLHTDWLLELQLTKAAVVTKHAVCHTCGIPKDINSPHQTLYLRQRHWGKCEDDSEVSD